MEKPYTDGQVMLKTHFSRHGGWYVVPFGCADPGECKGHIQLVTRFISVSQYLLFMTSFL